MIMKTRVKVGGAAVIASGLAACGSSSTGSAGSKPPVNGEIVIGVIEPITGSASALADEEIKGVKLAVKHINQKGGVDGRKVSLVIRDDKSDPAEAVSVARNMVKEDKPIAIVGSAVTATCYAVNKVIESAKVPQFCLSPATVPDDHEFYFSTLGASARSLGDRPMNWFLKKGYKKIGLLVSSDATGQLYKTVVTKAARGAGITITEVETMDPAATDASTQMTKIRSTSPDAIYAAVTGQPLLPILKSYRQLNMKIPIWAGQGNSNVKIASLIKDSLPKAGVYSGAETVQVARQLPKSNPYYKRANEFSKKFASKYDEVPGHQAAAAADAVNMIAAAVASIGASATPSEIRDYVEGPLDYRGIMFDYKFDNNNHQVTTDSGLVVRFTHAGSFKLVTTIKDVKKFS